MFSDEWIRELDYQRPVIPSSNIDSNLSLLKPVDFREIPPERPQRRLDFQGLPSNTQHRIINDLSDDLIDYEVQNLLTEISGETLNKKVR